MTGIRRALQEIFGLVVDDSPFASSILVWIAAVWLVLPRMGVPSPWNAALLFVGLAALLLGSALRQARR